MVKIYRSMVKKSAERWHEKDRLGEWSPGTGMTGAITRGERMNGFHARGWGMSAHDSVSTTQKKMANWTVGKSTTGAGP